MKQIIDNSKKIYIFR